MMGSGALVDIGTGGPVVVTAAHVVGYRDTARCNAVTIEADNPNTSPVTDFVSAEQHSRADPPEPKKSSKWAEYNGGNDVAVVLPAFPDAFKDMPAIPVASTPPKRGDPLFTLGYEPKATTNAQGEPDQQHFHPSQDAPSVAAHIVLGREEYGDDYATVVTQQIYTDDREVARSGSSGSPLIDKNGHFVGVWTAGHANRPAEDVADRYNVKDLSLLGRKTPLVSVVKLTSAALLRDLQRQAAQRPSC